MLKGKKEEEREKRPRNRTAVRMVEDLNLYCKIRLVPPAATSLSCTLFKREGTPEGRQTMKRGPLLFI